jgi:hypothetical protein
VQLPEKLKLVVPDKPVQVLTAVRLLLPFNRYKIAVALIWSPLFPVITALHTDVVPLNERLQFLDARRVSAPACTVRSKTSSMAQEKTRLFMKITSLLV